MLIVDKVTKKLVALFLIQNKSKFYEEENIMKFQRLTSGEMIKLGNDLTSEIERRKELTKQEFIKQGYIEKKDRLTYENIDLTDLQEKLILLLYNYHEYGGNIASNSNINMLDKVCLAAMCQFIKSEYHIRAYTKDYTILTGLKINTRFYSILENGFKQEGILPENWDKMKGFRYKDTLINETGVPKYLANEMLNLFKIYWKYLRQFEFDYMYENLDKVLGKIYIRDINDIDILRESYLKLSEYPRKVKTVIKQLSDVCRLLEEGNYYEEDLEKDEVVRGINRIVKFDIFRILPRKDSLKALYIQILSKVSVNKFENILQNAPGHIDITIPSGSRKSSLKYSDIQLGVYNMNSPVYRIYTVLPHTSLSINKLSEFKKDKFTKIKDGYIGYRASQPYIVKLGKYKQEKAYPLYDNKRIKGYYWYGKIPNAMPIIINSNRYEPIEFVDYSPIFKYCYNDVGSYTYNLSLNNFKIYLPSYSNEKIAIKCNYSDETKYLNIDNEGYIENKRLVFNINKVISDEPVYIEINHIMKDNNDILYKQSIEKIDDINLYVKNLRESNYSKTTFEYNLKEKDWKFDEKIIFHIEQGGNNSKIITNIKNASQEIEVLANYDNKYNQFLLEEIITVKGKNIFISNDKLREKAGIKDNVSAKVNLKFTYNYGKIFETDLLVLGDIKFELDSKVYTKGEVIDIKIKYKDKIYNEKSEVDILTIKDTLVSRLRPISVYIEEIDSYYTQYIKPDILGFLVIDKSNDEISQVNDMNFDDIDRYKVKIQSSLNTGLEILINDIKVDNKLINDSIIDLADCRNLFNKSKNIISINQYGKKVELIITKDFKQSIFSKPNDKLKWYEIDEVYTKEKLKEDIGKLGEILRELY